MRRPLRPVRSKTFILERSENNWATREQYNVIRHKDSAGKLLYSSMDFKETNGTVVSVHLINMSTTEKIARRLKTNIILMNKLIKKK